MDWHQQATALVTLNPVTSDVEQLHRPVCIRVREARWSLALSSWVLLYT